jgi:hypothetical protein
MTTAAAASTNLTPAAPLKISQRVRTQLDAANARIDQGAVAIKGALARVGQRLRALFPVPSRGDIAELSARLERLEKEIDRLVGSRGNGVPEPTVASVAEKRVRKPRARSKD